MTAPKKTAEKAEPKDAKPSKDPAHGAEDREQWQALRDACSVEVLEQDAE